MKPDYVVPITGVAMPPLVVMTLGMRTTVNPKSHQNEVAMISCLIHHEFPLDRAPPQPPFQTHFCGEFSDIGFTLMKKNFLIFF